MSVKTRLVTVILSGLLLGLLAVKLEHSSVPVDRALLSDDDAIRNPALKKLQALKGTGEKGRIVGELAAKGVKAPSPRTRVFALYALRKSGWKGPRVIGPMINALSDPDPKVREEAAVGLQEEGPAIFPQVFWTSGNPAVRNVARDVAHDLPPDSVKIFQRALTIRGQQRGGTFFLSQIARPDTIAAARSLAPFLVENMKSTDTVLAVNSAFALNTVDPKDPRPYPVFLKLIRQPNWEPWDVRGADALAALANAPQYKAQLLPFLRDALMNAPDGWIKGRRFKRPAIADALNQLAPLPSNLPALVSLLSNPSANARWRAVYAIGSATSVDSEALAPLVKALDDKDQNVAARALFALDRLGAPTAERAADTIYPKLISTFQRVTLAIPGFWLSASHAIAGLGQRALPLTFDAVRTGKLSPDKAAAIVRALSTDVAPAPFLKEALADSNADVRLVAAMGLTKFAPGTDGVNKELQANLQTRQGALHDDILRALGQGPKRAPGKGRGKGKGKGQGNGQGQGQDPDQEEG